MAQPHPGDATSAPSISWWGLSRYRTNGEMMMSGERYLLPEHPGYSARMRPETLRRFAFPHGAEAARPAPGRRR